MKIFSVSNTQIEKKNNPSFKSISFLNYNDRYSLIKTKLKQELEKLSDNKNSTNVASILGEGKFGTTYRFNAPELRDVVIKKNKNNYIDDYKDEYNNLLHVPIDRIGGQAGIARAYNNSTGDYYLLSTLAKGKEISPYNRYTENHLKSLFDKMFELDKVGLYHGDLNGKNILLTNEGEINFIDYQWAQVVDKTNFFDGLKSQKLLLPMSHFPENAQMFEMATMPYYLEKIGTQNEKEKFLKMYLKNKAQYHRKRYEYIKDITRNWAYSSEYFLIQDSLNAEKAKAKIYAKPTDNVLKIELKKFQFLSDYRDAYGHVDPNILDRNILASTSSYICSISAVQDYRKEIAKQMILCTDSDMLDYLRAQEEYGDYWYKNLEQFSSDTFSYVMRAITKRLHPEEQAHQFYIDERNPRNIKPNRDVLYEMNSRFHTLYERNFLVPDDIQDTMHNIFSVPMKDIKTEISNDQKAIHRCKKIQHAYKELKDFNRQGKVLDLLNTAELITLKTREFNGYAYHNMNSVKLDNILDNIQCLSEILTKNIYNTILKGLKEYDANSIVVQGYEFMRKFALRI